MASISFLPSGTWQPLLVPAILSLAQVESHQGPAIKSCARARHIMGGLLAFSEEEGRRVIFGHGHLLPHHFPKHFTDGLVGMARSLPLLSESAPVDGDAG